MYTVLKTYTLCKCKICFVQWWLLYSCTDVMVKNKVLCYNEESAGLQAQVYKNETSLVIFLVLIFKAAFGNTIFALFKCCRIISSNRSHIVKLPLSRVSALLSNVVLLLSKYYINKLVDSILSHFLIFCFCWQQLKFMHTTHQFLLLSSPPAKEARFRTARKLYGSTFAFQWVY